MFQINQFYKMGDWKREWVGGRGGEFVGYEPPVVRFAFIYIHSQVLLYFW